MVLGLLSMGIFISCGDDDDSSNGPVIPANVNNNRNTSGPAEAQTRLEFPKLNSNGNSSVIVHNSELNYNQNENVKRYDTGVSTPEIPSPTGQYPNDPDCTIFQFSKDPYKNNGFDHAFLYPFTYSIKPHFSHYIYKYIFDWSNEYRKHY